MTPRQSIKAECERRGAAAVVEGCRQILDGVVADDDLLRVLGGPAAENVLAGGEGGRDGYWPRVWAVRGLLHEWNAVAVPAISAATHDDAWRVREMAAKVVARHNVESLFDDVVDLREDPVARVRAAAERALARLTSAGM